MFPTGDFQKLLGGPVCSWCFRAATVRESALLSGRSRIAS